MISIRKASERGKFVWGGLTSHHSFSFGDYYDPEYMGFRSLRVINDDVLEGGMGFPPHPHRDMEIVTYMVEGALEHEDSMGNRSVIRPGEAQRMTAGQGVTHSEFNHSKTERAHLLQIWILPERRGLEPGYEQKQIPLNGNSLVRIASHNPSDDAVHINQNASIYAGKVKAGTTIALPLSDQRFGWLQIISGDVRLNDTDLHSGDGAGISEMQSPELRSVSDSHFLFFELA